MYNKRKWKSFISIILILTLILPDLLNGFKMIYASTKNGDNTTQETATVSKTFKNVADGFKKVVVGITTPKDGYVAGGDLSAGFSMEITVDGDYLYSVYDQYKEAIGFPEFQDPNHEDESIDDYNNRVDEFFHNNEDMPVMSYDFNIGKDFSIDSVLLDKEMVIADEDGKELGKAIFSNSDEGLSVNVTFENQIYNRLDAQLGFEQVIEVKEECLKPEPVYVAWENDALIINTKEELEGETPVEEIPDTITKEGPSSVNDTTITYNIEVKGKKLNGYTVEDLLPTVTGKLNMTAEQQQYLDVLQMKVDGNEVTGMLTEDGKYQYTFPTDGSDIQEAEISITVALTDAQKKAFSDLMYTSDNDASIQLTNKAKLYSDKTKEAVAVSEDVNTTMAFKLLNKTCKQDSLNGDRFKWVIDLNSTFNGYGIDQSYILDSIDTTSHMYDATSGIVIEKDNKSTKLPLTYLGEVNGDYGSNIYETLSKVDNIDTLLSNNKWVVTKGNAYYFTYNGQAVMIIPTNDYLAKNVKLTYYTVRNNENNTNNESIKNDVKLAWKYTGGEGPQGISDFSFNVSKTGDINKSLGYKNGISYNEKTKELRWKVVANYYPEDLKNVQINDELAYNIQRLSDKDTAITYQVWDRESRTVVRTGNIVSGTEGSTKPYYTLDNTETTDQKMLSIHFGDLTKNELLEITITTNLVDSSILGKNVSLADKTYVNNHAVIQAELNNETVTEPVDGEQVVTNTLITKDAVGDYNYKTNEFTWKVNINPNNIQLSNMNITDALPEGTVFGKLVSVKRIQEDGTESEANVIDNTATFTDGVSWNVVDNENSIEILSTVNTTDSFEFKFTTKVTDEKIKSVLHNGIDRNITLVNTAGLNANYVLDGNTYPVFEQDDATNRFKVQAAYKTGEYKSGENFIPWRVLVNIEHINMTGVKVTEVLPELLELDTDSLKVYKASVNTDGSLDLSSIKDENLINQADLQENVVMTSRGFEYTIPAKFANQPLYFMFDTYFLDNVTEEDIKNTVTLSQGDIDYTTEPSTGKYDNSFDLDQFVKTSKKPLLLIKKKSINSVGETKGLPLGDASFILITYAKESIQTYKDNGDYKEITSKDSGNGTYVNLKTDVLYELKETQAPNGYKANLQSQYYVFLKAGESLPAAISLKDESGNEIENISTDDIQVFQQNTSKGGIYYDDQGDTPIIEYKDMVADSNNIQFKKTGQDNTGLAGSIFTLTKQDGVVNNSSNWKATSDATGEVQFTEVDAGKDADHKLAYTMTETVTADKYHDQGASFTVYTWMESGQFKYTIESKNTSLATVSTTDDSYTIKNVYRQGKITFKKVDSVTENGISNVKFDIYNAGTSNKINTTSAVSNSSGVVTFDNIPYNAAGYDIKESENATGYQNTLVGSTVLTITGNQVETAINSASASTDGKKKTAFAIDLSNNSSSFVKNERIKGDILFIKNDSNGEVHSGRKFALVLTDADAEKYFINSNPAGTDVLDGNENIKGVTDSKYNTTNGIILKTAVSGSDGKVSFTDVPYGNYKIIELTSRVPGDNYSEVASDNITKAAIVNAAKLTPGRNSFNISLGTLKNTILKTSVTIEKRNSVTNDVMSGVHFKLTGVDVDGKAYNQEKTTYSTGKLLFTDIPVGSYVMTETSVQGYEDPKTYVMEVVSEYDSTKKQNSAVAHLYEAEYDEVNSKWIKTDNEVANDSEKFVINNTPRKTSFKFVKTDNKGTLLKGVTFSLYRKKADQTYDTTKAYTATSDVNGVVAFENVYYGEYKVVETRPEGYKANDDFVITTSDFDNEYAVSGSSDFTFNLNTVANKNSLFSIDPDNKMSMKIVNNIVNANIKVNKKDQDQNNLSAKFEILRDDADKTQTGIKFTTVAQTGNSNIFNLPYGKYIINETECTNVLSESSTDQLLKIYIQVGEKKNADDQWISDVKVNKIFIADKEVTGTKQADYVKLTGNDADGYTFNLINDIKYGYIQINKYLTEADGTEDFALQGAKFRIDKLDGETYSHYITLTTNTSGQFTVNADGTYTGENAYGNKISKHLLYGTYKITELSTGKNYNVNSNKSAIVTFGEGAGETSNGKYAVISGNGTDPSALLVTNNLTENDTTKKLYNTAARGTFTLKKQAEDGTELNQAGFIIYNAATDEKVGSFVNKGNGIYNISGNVADDKTNQYNKKDEIGIPVVYKDELLHGNYYLKEYKTDSGYILNDTDKVFFTVSMDGKVSFTDVDGFATFDQTKDQLTVINRPAKIVIEKQEFNNDSIKVDHAVFELFKKQDNNTYPKTGATYTTDQDGMIRLNVVAAGTYKLVEKTAKSGYVKSDVTVEFTLNEYGDISTSSSTDELFAKITGNKIVFKNKPNGILFDKAYFNLNTELTTDLPEATFGLYKGEELKYTVTTNDQKAVLNQVADGAYSLKEINTGDNENYILKNNVLAEIQINDGKITAINKDSDKLSTTGSTQESLVLSIKNYKKQSIEFTKLSSATGNALDGVTFSLTNSKGFSTSSVSKDNGKVVFANLMPDTYVLKETATVDGYCVTNAIVNVTVDNNGKITYTDHSGQKITDLSKTFVNDQTNLLIKKVDENGDYVSGVELTITGDRFAGGSDQLVLTTENKPINITGKLITGVTYTITETGRKTGYTIAKAETFKMESNGVINGVTGNTIVMRDDHIKGNIKLIKVIPADMNGYEGITFDLYKSNDDIADALDTIYQSGITLDDNGNTLVSNLPEGYYYFVETATRDTLYLDQTPSEVVYIGNDQHNKTVDVTVNNVKLDYKVTLTKINGYTSDPLPGAEFTLYDDNTQVVGTYETDENGKLLVDINRKGTYTLKETKAPYGFNIATSEENPYSVTFTVDNTAAYQGEVLDLGNVTNERKSGIVNITKKSDDGKVLSGAKFKITGKFADQSVKDYVWTSKEGAKVFGNELLIGETYEITEISAPAGYITLKDSIHFTVSDKENNIVIENKPISVTFNFINRNNEILDDGKILITGLFSSGENESIEIDTDKDNANDILKGKLIAGQIYLVQVERYKDGYKFVDHLSFKVEDDGTITIIQSDRYRMDGNLISIIGDQEKNKDNNTNSEISSDSSNNKGDQTNKTNNSVKTGDSMDIIRYMLILVISGFSLVRFMNRKKEIKQK